ncbi:MAG: ribulose-phosphate 3-epimerase [Kiritimatiellaeota bacterium]|nr:ribulose-phosphate 3-epimerase [Kiritimatiellota bacterium]
MSTITILPSLLAADPGRLAEECRRAVAAGANGLHVDIMDGHLVANLSLGPNVVAMARRTVKVPLSTHLMVTHPQHFVDLFIQAGANPLLIHVEAQCDVRAVLRAIRGRGVRAGLTLNPETPVEAVVPFLDEADEILFMSVHPGLGGQAFIPQVLPKIADIRRRAPNLPLSIDGGINRATAVQAAEQGAHVFIIGTFLFQAPDMAAEIVALRRETTAAYGRKTEALE